MPVFRAPADARPPGPARPVVRRSGRAGRGAEGGPCGRHLRPRPLGRRRHAGQLHVAGRRTSSGQGRDDPVPLRPDPVTIVLKQTAKVVNTSKRVVIDGGGLVTLSGGGERRILYQNTCDPKQTWTTDHCDDQATPRLVLQNLTLADGDSTGETLDGGGGGAIFARGGRLKIVGSTFPATAATAPDPTWAGRPSGPSRSTTGLPVYVVASTFKGGRCSNGSALSSIGVSWSVVQQHLQGQPGRRPRRQPR